MLLGVAVSCPEVTAVPARGTFKVGLAEFELTARLPVTLPLDVGAKVTLMFTLCAAASVKGSVGPEALNPAPVALMAEIVTLAPPVLLSVSVAVCEFPI